MASFSPWGVLLFLVATLGIGSYELPGTHPVTTCAPFCQDHRCSTISVKPLDNQVCACRKYLLLDNKPAHKIWLKRRRSDSIIIKWKSINQPSSGTAMLCISTSVDVEDCFSVVMEKRTTQRFLKVRCAVGDVAKPNVTLFGVIYGSNWEIIGSTSRIKRQKQRHAVRKRRTTLEDCCWTPIIISLAKVGNRSIRVRWSPFSGPRRIRVRIHHDYTDETQFDVILAAYYVCENQVLEHAFEGLEPNKKYIAQVGETGGHCECTGYSKSAPFSLSLDMESAPLALSLDMEEHNKNILGDDVFHPHAAHALTGIKWHSEKNLVLISAFVIGIFFVIGFLSVGLKCYYQRRKRRDAVTNGFYTIPGISPSLYLSPTSDDKDLVECVQCLEDLFEKCDVSVVTNALESPSDKDLVVNVSLQDVHAHENRQDWTRRTSFNRISAVSDYSRPQVGLVFRIPRGLEHSLLKGVRNNAREGDQNLDLVEFIRTLKPGVNPRCSHRMLLEDVTSIANRNRDGLDNVLMISGCDHPSHVQACVELCKLLGMLGKTVNYMFDPEQRQQMQRVGPLEWTLQKANEADLILVVSSVVLFKCVQCYDREEPFPSGMPAGTICAPLTLKHLSRQSVDAKVICVSFGYWSAYIDDISMFYPRVDFETRYDLVENKGGTMPGDEHANETTALKIFFRRLCSDSSRVVNACEFSAGFDTAVREMAYITTDAHWLSRVYGSAESM